MTDRPIGRLDVSQHPHKGETVAMKPLSETDRVDASAKPTPFLIAGFDPVAERNRLRKSSATPPEVSVVSSTSNTNAASKSVAYLFAPQSVDQPNSANAAVNPVQTRPRSRSTQEVASPRNAQRSAAADFATKDESFDAVELQTAPNGHSAGGGEGTFNPASLPQLRTEAAAPAPVRSISGGFTAANTHTPFDDDEDDFDHDFKNSAFSPRFPPPPPPQPQPILVDSNTLDFFTSAAANAKAQPPKQATAAKPPLAARSTDSDIASRLAKVNMDAVPKSKPAAKTAPSSATASPMQTARRTQQPQEEEDEDDEDDEDEEDDDEDEEDDESGAGKKKKFKKEKLDPIELSKWAADPDFYFNEFHTDSVTSMGFHKHQVVWRFVLDGRVHELELFHSLFSGKRRLRMDTVELLTEKVLFDGGSSHEIRIGRRKVEVIIYVSGALRNDFQYELIIEGQPFQRAKRHWVINVQRAVKLAQLKTLEENEKKRKRNLKRATR